MTAMNDAKFWKDGKIQEIAGKDLMRSAEEYDIYPGFAFYAYPNRDSSVYKERYHIPEAHTIIRGSLRYKGYTALMKTIVAMGFVGQEKHDFLKQPISWKEATQKLIGASSTSEE